MYFNDLWNDPEETFKVDGSIAPYISGDSVTPYRMCDKNMKWYRGRGHGGQNPFAHTATFRGTRGLVH